jgi:hypothetical protein
LGSRKCWKVLEWLHNWRLLKKGSAPWMSEIRWNGYDANVDDDGDVDDDDDDKYGKALPVTGYGGP